MKIYIEQDDVKLSFERAQELDYQILFKVYQMVTGSDEILEDLSQKEPENTKTVLKMMLKSILLISKKPQTGCQQNLVEVQRFRRNQVRR